MWNERGITELRTIGVRCASCHLIVIIASCFYTAVIPLYVYTQDNVGSLKLDNHGAEDLLLPIVPRYI